MIMCEPGHYSKVSISLLETQKHETTTWVRQDQDICRSLFGDWR